MGEGGDVGGEGGRRFIVVDDERAMRDVLVRSIRRIFPSEPPDGIRSASGVEGALEALEAAPVEAPLVVIADYDLGLGGSGIELLDEVRRRRPDARRMLVSARSPEELRPSMDRAGVEAFLPKPFAFVDFRSVVLRLAGEPPPADDPDARSAKTS